MKLKLDLEYSATKLLIKGWHISKEPDVVMEELGSDNGKGYLLVSVRDVVSESAFGTTWDAAGGYTKKWWLDAGSVRGGDEIHGLILAGTVGVGSPFIRLATEWDEGEDPIQTFFETNVCPGGSGDSQRLIFGSTYEQGNIDAIAELEDNSQVVTNGMPVVMESFGNPTLTAQLLTGYVRFQGMLVHIDASNIFPNDPVDGERKFAYVDSEELPVDMDVFSRNFTKFEFVGGSIVQLPATSLDNRVILADDVNTSKPLALRKANTSNLFANL